MPLRIIAMLLGLMIFASLAFSADRRPGAIKMSDGTVLEGELWFNSSEFKVYEGEGVAGGRFVKVTQAELDSIIYYTSYFTVEHPWRFKNAGSDEKEILAGEYPLLELGSTVRLTNGQAIKGHMMAIPIYVRVKLPGPEEDYDTKKIFLKYQYKGEVGQTVKDLVHVVAIVFGEGAKAKVEAIPIDSDMSKVSSPKADTVGGKVIEKGGFKGTIPAAWGKIEQVAAFGIKRGRSYDGKADPKTGGFVIDNLPEDDYDIAALTDKAAYIGFSDKSGSTDTDPRPLEAKDLGDINTYLAKFRDFFDDQKALAVKGNRESAKVLVMQRRLKPIYDNESLKGKQIVRLDVWLWHLRQTEWSIDPSIRANLFRYHETPGEKRMPVYVPEMEAIHVLSGTKTLELK